MRTSIFFLPLFVLAACGRAHKTGNLPGPGMADSAGTAELRFMQKKIDFGYVPGDTVLTGKYDFVNPSADTLVITSVNPDCTCTGYTLSKERIPPHDSGYITLKVSTREKTGAVVLYSTISANTPTRLYSLKMMAHVR
jgi:hypothetical protein